MDARGSLDVRIWQKDGCEETQGVREKRMAKSHMHVWREKLWGGL